MYALFLLQFLLSEWVGLNIKELTKGFDRFIRINFELLHQQDIFRMEKEDIFNAYNLFQVPEIDLAE
jgi:hypothetical protein